MLILNAQGQTCNKFFTYLAYLGDCIESDGKIIVLSPDITLKYFPEMKKSKFIRFPLFSENISEIIGYNRYINILKFLFSNRYSVKILELFFKLIPNIKFISAAINSYDSKTHLKYTAELKKIFTPDYSITSEVDEFFNTITGKFDIVCGVHIRRGDYAEWNNGRFYYSDSQFYDVMLKFQELFKEKSVVFFIASNDKVNFSIFDSCEYFSIPDSNAVKDLYGLGKCNYIIGPPSSFSGWASYYGNKPISFIENPKQEIKISSFRNIMDIW